VRRHQFQRVQALALLRGVLRHAVALYLSHGIVIGLWQSVLPIERGAAYEIVEIGTAIAVTALALNPLTETLQRRLRRAFDAGLALGARGFGMS